MIIRISEIDKLKNDSAYQDFLNSNPGVGNIKVRATSANEAFPVSGVSVVVSKVIGDNTIIFFEGMTDESGMINGIKLPTPSKNFNDLEAPAFTTYKLRAVYDPDKFDRTYDVALCCGVSIIQYINITPLVNMEERYGN